MTNEYPLDSPKIISIQETSALAKKMFEDQYPDIEFLEKLPNNDIEKYWLEIPQEIRNRYWGHGVDKYDDLQQFIATVSIAETGSISGTTSSFDQPDWIAPYLNGDSLVISKIDRELIKPEHEYIEIDDGTGRTKGAYKVEIGAIVLNTHLYAFYDQLRLMYPTTPIIRATELVEHVLSEVRSV